LGLLILAKIFFGAGHPPPGHRKRSHPWRKRQHHKEDTDVPPPMTEEQQKLYEQYWHEQGKASFEAYMKKMEEEKGPETEE
jgi:hypothetical protein